MKATFLITMEMDKRYQKKNGEYPVKLLVYNTLTQNAKRFPTKFSFTESDFKSIWETTRPRDKYKDNRNKMEAVRVLAVKTAESISPFSFEAFEKKLYRSSGDGDNVFWHYQEMMDELRSNNQLGTASNYNLSLKSIKAFIEHNKGSVPKSLSFSEITPAWLNRYESYMLGHKEASYTTVSFYVRALRTIFNRAIKLNDADKALYPFGSDGYRVPSVKRVKKALNKPQLKALFEAKPRTEEQQKAKDFWFFSYTCNGMNIKDIALLRFENLDNGTLKFIRAKTIRTSKENLKEVGVPLTDFAQQVIKQYSNPSDNPRQYIFPIISDNDSEERKRAKIQNFTRFVNQNLKKLAIAEGITGEISSYWARHSFATNAIRQGASMDFVSEAFSHSSLTVTKGYFAGFEDDDKKQLMDSLMQF